MQRMREVLALAGFSELRPVYRKILELAEPYLETRQNLVHTAVAYRFVVHLLSEEGGETDVVVPAVLLHDVGWSAVPEELQLKAFGPGPIDEQIRRVHEVEGVKIAREILLQVKWDQAQAQEILQIIDGHDSRLEALSLNDAVVKDADKLFRFSQEGFAIDCQRFKLSFEDRVRQLRGLVDQWLFTEAARRMAREELQRRTIGT